MLINYHENEYKTNLNAAIYFSHVSRLVNCLSHLNNCCLYWYNLYLFPKYFIFFVILSFPVNVNTCESAYNMIPLQYSGIFYTKHRKDETPIVSSN